MWRIGARMAAAMVIRDIVSWSAMLCISWAGVQGCLAPDDTQVSIMGLRCLSCLLQHCSTHHKWQELLFRDSSHCKRQ